MLRTLLLVILFLLFATVQPLLATTQVVVAGTGDSQELLRQLAVSYHSKVPGVQVQVPESIGSSGGVKATAKGSCDLGRIARPLKTREKTLGLHQKMFAFSPVVFVVNRSVRGVTNLSTAQLLDIYSGKLSNWKQLGGPDAPILVANREKGDSSRTVLEKNIPGFEQAQKAGKTVFSTPEAEAVLTANPNTIGYLPLAMAKHPELVVLKLDGIAPTAKNVLSGHYKLVTPFGIVWRSGTRPEALGFMSYLFTPEAQQQMESLGVIAARQ